MVGLVDINGRPFKPADLKVPQSNKAQVGERLHREWAAHPVRGLTPSRLAATLEQAELGDLAAQADLFEDMEEKDGHVLSEMGKRKRAILTLDWGIKPPRNPTPAEEEDAAWLKEVIEDMDGFETLLTDLLDAIGKGYSCCEIEWDRSGGEWRPLAITHRPPRWFTLDRETRTQLLLRNGLIDGEPLQPFGWVTHLHKAKSGYLARAGLMRSLCWPFLFKNYAVRDLAEFLEIYGLPLRLGKYPTSATADEKRTLLDAVTQIGHAAAGIIPEGMMIDFVEAAKGAADPYEAQLDWCERTQSKIIVGQVLSAEAKSTGMGSGVADLQGGVLWDITVSDARQLGPTLSRDLLYPLLVLNRRVVDPRRRPRLMFDTSEGEDLKTYSDAVPRLVDYGARIPVDWLHEKLKIPQARDDEPVLARAAGAPMPPPDPSGAAALRAQPSRDLPTAADRLAQQLGDRAGDPLRAWLNQVRDLVDTSRDLAELRDRLVRAYGDLPSDDLAKVMQLAFATADLAGRFDVAEGAGVLPPK